MNTGHHPEYGGELVQTHTAALHTGFIAISVAPTLRGPPQLFDALLCLFLLSQAKRQAALCHSILF